MQFIMKVSAVSSYLVVILSLFPFLALSLPPPSSPAIAGPLGKHCTKGSKHTGTPKGKNVTIAGVPTYFAEPPKSWKHGPSKKVIIFYSDVFGAFHINNELVQDYFASRGFYVLGVDYFLGDPIGGYVDGPELGPLNPNFDLEAWFSKSRKQADDVLPKWHEAVWKRYGPNAKYSALGYCFGSLYAMQITATDRVVAGAFAHPADLSEDHFQQLKRPLLLSCADDDASLPPPNLNRAVEILTKTKAMFNVQIFSGTSHGFATRGDLSDENAVWAKEESARGIAGWFDRFSK